MKSIVKHRIMYKLVGRDCRAHKEIIINAASEVTGEDIFFALNFKR